MEAEVNVETGAERHFDVFSTRGHLSFMCVLILLGDIDGSSDDSYKWSLIAFKKYLAET
jgi:hypothetical protein